MAGGGVTADGGEAEGRRGVTVGGAGGHGGLWFSPGIWLYLPGSAAGQRVPAFTDGPAARRQPRTDASHLSSSSILIETGLHRLRWLLVVGGSEVVAGDEKAAEDLDMVDEALVQPQLEGDVLDPDLVTLPFKVILFSLLDWVDYCYW
jgi:hypothetical protein